MYIAIETNNNINPGDTLVIKSDLNGGIGVYNLSEVKVGTLSGVQPEGCLDYWTIASRILNNRIICDVAVKCGNAAILHSESRTLSHAHTFERKEVAGYCLYAVR